MTSVVRERSVRRGLKVESNYKSFVRLPGYRAVVKNARSDSEEAPGCIWLAIETESCAEELSTKS